jgi:hypothetical protein
MLPPGQLKFLTDVLVAVGEVSLASLIIPYFVSADAGASFFAWGVIVAAASWIMGFVISGRIVE